MFQSTSWRLLLILIFVVCPNLAIYAENLPAFRFWASTWHATDIVVVDRKGLIQDVWKGELKPGDTLPIAKFKLTESADVHYGPRRLEARIAEIRPSDAVLKVSGHRRALFLNRNAADSSEKAWRAADTSTVWIENDQCFVIRQLSNNEALLHPLRKDHRKWWRGVSESQLKSDVLEHCDIQSRLEAASQVKDPAERAKALVTFLDPQNRMLRYEVTRYISECGKPAWPAIRPLLVDNKHLAIHDELISLAFRVDYEASVPDVEAIVQEEAEYWRNVPLDTTPVWYSKPPASEHFARLKAALSSLKRGEYIDRRGLVASLRHEWNESEFLRGLGAGNDKRSPVLKHADSIVGEVDAEFARERLQAIKQMADRAINEIPKKQDTGVLSIAESIAVQRQSEPAIPGFREEKLKQLRRIRNALQDATGRDYGPIFDFLERLVNERAE